MKQFAGGLAVSADAIRAGEPFVLRVAIHNGGVYAWEADYGPSLTLDGDPQRLGLPAVWPYQGPVLVFGDRRVIELRGRVPRQAGEIRLRISLRTPYQGAPAFGEKEVTLRWK